MNGEGQPESKGPASPRPLRKKEPQAVQQDGLSRTEAGVRLREQIDELATRVVLGGASGDLCSASIDEIASGLVQLNEQACAAGCGEIARHASELAGTLRSVGDGDLQSLENSLREGIARLQRAIEGEGREESPSEAGRAAADDPRPAPLNPLAQDPELLSDFIQESREHLASIEVRLLALEQEPANAEAIHSVFRGFHTIKGLAGFLELAAIQELSHEVETLLDLARNSKLAITAAVVDLVLESADCLKISLTALEPAVKGFPPHAAPGHEHLLSRIRALAGAEEEGSRTSSPAAGSIEPFEPPSEAGPKPQAQAESEGKAPESFSVRVDTGKLDYLMDMVGEMVIAQSLIRHNRTLSFAQDPRLLGDLALLTRVTGEVQRTAMSMRMVAVRQLFQRTARVVRDLSRKTGKQFEMETTGEDTELDKTIVEELADPLLHMVRNAIDHGAEPPEEREAAGKNRSSRLVLAASHQGGQIVIEVSDDGRGLDRQKILEKAQEKGLVQAGSHLTDSEVFNLIFEPGFSTAAQVTEVSGRGVGMDVVRRHVQKLRGRIEIQSKKGVGTKFLLKLPLTLAIIEGLVVGVGSQRYIVPLFAVEEVFRPDAGSLVTVQGRQEMTTVRGRLLPVVRLHRRFGVTPRSEDPCESLLIVAENDEKPYCLMVDELIGKQEVVIKSLGETLKNVPGIAGGAILGDGRVGLILDVEGLFRAVAHG